MVAGKLNFKLATAMVTPFTVDNQIDWPAVTRLVQQLIDTGTQAIVVNGTTGESPTTSRAEKKALLEAVKTVIGTQPVALIAGTGTNNTQSSLDLAQDADAVGVDAHLVVTPYYNKPSQKGLIAHFSALAQATQTPMIFYNIPGRSVINMLPETMASLVAQYPQFIGVKQSHPDMDQASEIRKLLPSSFTLWSGDDSLTLPMLALGAQGVVSVASHLVGQPIRDMLDAFASGQSQQALAIHLKLLPCFKGLFTLPNPTVLKALLANQGLIAPYYRLPLVPPDEADMAAIKALEAEMSPWLSSQPVLR